MALLVDLSDSDAPDNHRRPSGEEPCHRGSDLQKPVWPPKSTERHDTVNEASSSKSSSPKSGKFDGFAAALSCYPIVCQLGSLLDLNSLHALSRTCRQFRVNLLQYRNQLVHRTLQCAFEKPGYSAKDHRSTRGRFGLCARDMVSECRKCGIMTCRNCVAKPLPYSCLPSRHRRLCRLCCEAPLLMHTSLNPPPSSTGSSPTSSPARLYRFPSPDSALPPKAFTSRAFTREPCRCPEEFWLCHDCKTPARAADVSYARGWTWRTRYCALLGGLGTGVGEGNEGVECGKRSSCVAARMVEQEIECDVDSLAELQRSTDNIRFIGPERKWIGTGFMVQEVEGLGGAVKRKVRKMVSVGQEVEEHEEERERERSDHAGSMTAVDQYLVPEKNGDVRSWCAWCERVIPSNADIEDIARDEA